MDKKIILILLLTVLPYKFSMNKQSNYHLLYVSNVSKFAKSKEIKKKKKKVLEDLGDGLVSYYGRKFHGRKTASGEVYDSTKLTAAHRKYPFGTKLKVTNPKNGKSVIVVVNDRGPFSGNRVLDLSYLAAEKVGIIESGVARLDIEKVF